MVANFKTLTEQLPITDSLLLARPYAFVTNSVRTSISTLLRLRRRPVRYVTFELPPHYAYLEPGDWVWTAHELMPEAPTGTQRYDAWRLVPLYVVEVYDPLSPGKVKIKAVDMRETFASWWSPLLTDLGMTDDLNGIAIIDRSGGWETTRDQVAYGIRPPANDAYQEVLANQPVVCALGLQCEGGGEVNHLLNSAFSEGSGDTFTSWTPTTSGAAVVVGWTLYTLIDATGFRRTPQFATYATGEQSYLSQTVGALENRSFNVKVYYKDGGAIDRMGLRVQRSDTSEYLDSAGAWQAGVQTISLTPGSGVIETLRYVSPQFNTTAGGGLSLTVQVGHFSAAYDGAQISQPQGVELVETLLGYYALRTPLPTKAAAVTRINNYTWIVNDSAVRVVSPIRGFVKLTIRPEWAHTDLTNTSEKYIWAADFDGATNTEWLRVYYIRNSATAGEYRFKNADGQTASFATSGATLPAREQTYDLAWRWTSEAENEHDLDGQALDIWVDGVRGTTAEGGTTQAADAACNVYLGCTVTKTDSFLDGHISNVTMDDRCPSEEELLRI